MRIEGLLRKQESGHEMSITWFWEGQRRHALITLPDGLYKLKDAAIDEDIVLTTFNNVFWNEKKNSFSYLKNKEESFIETLRYDGAEVKKIR